MIISVSLAVDRIDHVDQPQNFGFEPGLFPELAKGALADCLALFLAAAGNAPLPLKWRKGTANQQDLVGLPHDGAAADLRRGLRLPHFCS